MAVYGTFVSATGEELEKALWPTQGAPRGVVQFVHGMAEHIRRYDAAAQALNAAGYAVVGHTHAGHGEKARQLGYFADKDGWDALISDVHALRLETQKAYPGVPYVLLGHSMGSFVVRGYCLKYEKGLSGVALSGTGHFERPVVAAGRAVARLQCAFGGARKPAKLVEKLSSSGYNQGYEDPQTPFDWLSRDREVVAAYIADPYCGFTFTARAYDDMFEGLSRLYPDRLGAMEKDIPVYLFSGDQDPVGGHGKGVELVARELREAGVRDVTVRLYPGGRHEMFNEINREEVYADLIAWLDEKTVSGR